MFQKQVPRSVLNVLCLCGSGDDVDTFGRDLVDVTEEELFGPESDNESEGECSFYKEEPDDAAKMAYVNAALRENVEFEDSRPLDADLLGAIEWAKGSFVQSLL